MRLIDADALSRHKQLEAMGNGKYEDVEVVYANDIYNAPTIDAVPRKDYEELERHFVNWEPVVRCKDCRWWTKQEKSIQGRCALAGIYPTGSWYCGNGERKDDES